MAHKLTKSQKLIKAHGKKRMANVPTLKDGERAIFMVPAFEAIDPDPSKNYGIGGVHINFAMRKGYMVIEVGFLTNWFLPETQERLADRPDSYFRPLPTCEGLFFHHPKRSSEWQRKNEKCKLMGGKTCYGEAGSALYGEKITERLLKEGGNAVRDEIEQAFREEATP